MRTPIVFISCFNPCFNGLGSSTPCLEIPTVPIAVVSILVLMD